MTEKPKVKWCVEASLSLDKAVEVAVSQDSHSTKSEFIREAVRKQLEKMGYNPQVFFNKNKKLEVKA